MSLRMEDGSTGRRFVATCDGCGEEITAATPAERESERKRKGWTPGRELCAKCQAEALGPDGVSRPRFASRNRYV